MSEPSIPTYLDMMLPTLQAVERLGGSGTREEIDDAAIRGMGLTDEQVAVEYPPEATQKGSKVLHRLAFARTYLKKFGALDNSTRGVWTLEPAAKTWLDMDPVDASKALRAADAEVRREARTRRVLADAAVVPDTDSALAAAPTGDEQSLGDDETARDWRAELLSRLGELSPAAFERLAQRLLREAGFRNVEVTGRSGDRGIDGVGVYRPSLVSFPIYFQCKKWAGSVGSSEVRDFRGAMSGRGEKGLLITTGTFTAEARREATRDGAPPVDLIDGSDLCDLLKEFGVGVNPRLIEVVDVDLGFFDAL